MNNRFPSPGRTLAAIACGALLALGGAHAAETAAAKPAAAKPAAARPAPGAGPQSAEYAGPTQVAPAIRLASGKSALVRLQSEASRVSIGNPDVADVTLINPREIYFLGKKSGSTNVFVWSRSGPTTLMDVVVGVDAATLQSRLDELVPTGGNLKVDTIGDSVVLRGRIADAMKVQRIVALAGAHCACEQKIVNLMSVEGSQQIMLEVKVAEVSRTLLDKLGAEVDLTRSSGNTTFTLLGQLLTDAAGVVTGSRASGRTNITLDAEIRNGLVKILAEPTIMAVSGQEGTFLAGGKIYIPVPQSSGTGTTITLEEKEFGVGLRFTPTLLDEGRINLRVTPEVSELSQVGTTVRVGGSTSVLPTITTRRASTTVQLRDGETLAIGGLIKNNVTEAVKAFPGLGEVPVLGALFRSNEFQADRSELLFIVTPRLVKPVAGPMPLPTDSFVPPTRGERLLNGRIEGTAPAPGGFQLQ